MDLGGTTANPKVCPNPSFMVVLDTDITKLYRFITPRLKVILYFMRRLQILYFVCIIASLVFNHASVPDEGRYWIGLESSVLDQRL